jgi:hypothetical protein
MSQEEVERVAKGRVWSGEDAKGRGLVDELGGYQTVIRLAKAAADLPPEAPFILTVFHGNVVFRFARDSPLEGDGFELPVPRQGLLAAIAGASCGRNRGAARKSNYLGTPANRQYGPLHPNGFSTVRRFLAGLTLSPSVRGKSMPMSGRGPWPPRPIPDAT